MKQFKFHSKCCDPVTCQLRPHAECDEGGCCDECKLKSRGIPCRDADGEFCELPEFCDGTSAFVNII